MPTVLLSILGYAYGLIEYITSLYIYIYIHICMYTYMYMRMYIYIYIAHFMDVDMWW